MRFDIQVNYSRAIQTLLNDLPQKLIYEIRDKALLKTSAEIVAKAKSLVPVDTYALKRSIRARWSSRSKFERQVSATGGAGGRTYALYVEYGRKKLNRRDAQPFLRPALHSHLITARFKDEMRRAVSAAIRGVAKTGKPPKDTGASIGNLNLGLRALDGGSGGGGEAVSFAAKSIGKKPRGGKAKNIGYGFDLSPLPKRGRGRRGH